ncbi:toll/interleukin-1 receptor domain-containing protein [Bacillus cereus]|uniref:toll/interleukin-1 receptor domain-containing protein n=1 Tax=Bacillus cereus TaxID=1396 RepID=UPI0039808135
MSNNTLFISHASADSELVGKFVDFLELGLRINREEIYCTSGLGTKKIRPGTNFVTDIRDNISGTKLAVFFLTPNFFKSKFCLAELGATWALGNEIYPIIIPPTSFESLDPTPLKGVVQAISLNEPDDLVDLVEHFKELDIIESSNGAIVNVRAREFIKYLKTECNFEEEKVISKERFAQVEQNIVDLVHINGAQLKEINNLKKEKDELLKALAEADKTAAAEHKKTYSSQWEYFNHLVDETRECLKQIDDIAVSAIYYNDIHKTGYSFWPDDASFTKIKELEMYKIIIIDDDNILPNYAEPTVIAAQTKLNELRHYITHEAQDELYDLFKQEHGFELDISNKRFWDNVFFTHIYI